MNFSNPAFDVEYVLERDQRVASVTGTILNRLGREVSTALLSFHFYDADDVRVNQEQVFVNEIEPGEKVRFTAGVILDGGEIRSVKLVEAEPIPISDYPELSDAGEPPAGDGTAEQPRH